MASRDWKSSKFTGGMKSKSVVLRDAAATGDPVLVVADDEGRFLVSSRETAYKTRNLRADPWAQLCVFTDAFFGSWYYLEGTTEVLSLPDAMEPLVDYYRRAAGSTTTGTTTGPRCAPSSGCCCGSPVSGPAPTARAEAAGASRYVVGHGLRVHPMSP